MNGNIKVGLALGSGSARGWSHIGVIEELESLGIKPDIVVGSSIGALVGGVYVANYLSEFKQWVTQLKMWDVMGFLDVSLKGGGLVQGRKIFNYIQGQVGKSAIEDLDKRFAAVATDLETGQEVWFKRGPLMEAIQASCAIPGVFSPANYRDRWLVDGGVVNPVPVSLARALGADLVIAVNLNSDIVGKHFRKTQLGLGSPLIDTSTEVKKEKNGAESFVDRIGAYFSNVGEDGEAQPVNPGVMEVIASSLNIMQDRITRSRMAGDPPDVLLTPRLSELTLLEFHRAEEAIEEGRICVQRSKDLLKMVGLIS